MKIFAFLQLLYKKPVEVACGAIMVAIAAVVFLQVISRYVFSYPFDWPEELARFLFVWVALLGAALAVRRGAHFSINAMVKRLTPRAQVWIPLAIHAILAAFTMIVAVKGLQLALRITEQLSSGMEISMTYPYLSVPVGFAVMFWYIVTDMYQLVKKF